MSEKKPNPIIICGTGHHAMCEVWKTEPCSDCPIFLHFKKMEETIDRKEHGPADRRLTKEDIKDMVEKGELTLSVPRKQPPVPKIMPNKIERKCVYCDSIFPTLHKLILHLQTEHPDKATDIATDYFESQFKHRKRIT
ncbi:MAG: hypothetical protein ACTSPB_02360 [Candidatus Thorarchaeota archaeon]